MAYALLIGGKGSGRSAVMLELAGRLAARGLRVGGFVQLSHGEGEGRERIELVRLSTREHLALARTGGEPDERTQQGVCSLVFESAAFTTAARWVEEDAPAAHVVLLDGVGRLELRGQGHRAALERALGSGALALLSVRDEHLFSLLETLSLGEPAAAHTLEEGEAAREAFVEALVRAAAPEARDAAARAAPR